MLDAPHKKLRTNHVGWRKRCVTGSCREPFGLPESVVDLRQIHTIRRELLTTLCNHGKRCVRIRPLYRERLLVFHAPNRFGGRTNRQVRGVSDELAEADFRSEFAEFFQGVQNLWFFRPCRGWFLRQRRV